MKGFWVRAVYDFISSKTQDLSFRDGDILTITDVVSRNWWHAKNVVGEMGFIPSNFVQVLPQYGEATIECDSFIEEIEVQEHESSASSLQITFKSKDMGGEGQEPSTVSHNIVKTVPNLSQFVRELSRTFPEAGLPLEVQEGTEWAQLLGSLHEFNSTKVSQERSKGVLFRIRHAVVISPPPPTFLPSHPPFHPFLRLPYPPMRSFKTS